MAIRYGVRLLDCRKRRGRMSSLSFTPRGIGSADAGRYAMVSAHEGPKPVAGDYLALSSSAGVDRLTLYVVESMNESAVSVGNLWIAHVRFVPGREVTELGLELPELEP